MLSQIPTPASGAIETWLLSFAAIASIAVLAKKLFLSKPPTEQGFVTKTEFHHELGTLRDKIDARFLTLLEELNEAKTELLLRLTALDASVARLDERTKK